MAPEAGPGRASAPARRGQRRRELPARALAEEDLERLAEHVKACARGRFGAPGRDAPNRRALPARRRCTGSSSASAEWRRKSSNWPNAAARPTRSGSRSRIEELLERRATRCRAARAGGGPARRARRRQRGAGPPAQPRRAVRQLVTGAGELGKKLDFLLAGNAARGQYLAFENSRARRGRSGHYRSGFANQGGDRKTEGTSAERRMTTPAASPRIIIVSGPSGSGKSTLVQKLRELPGTMFSVSCTTRPPRATESPGKVL